ncbi:YfhO family protein [Actinotalea sp. BY-33]|uniref:YfhO family protein n=1 Tax=Actinotalea soli TaxID=2819234 RepID=A0A939LTB7_9CELL|nr:YfhO family protein [Actinotalea soli]MBO1750962.1 YfhO family protein [Actinotalea soli]
MNRFLEAPPPLSSSRAHALLRATTAISWLSLLAFAVLGVGSAVLGSTVFLGVDTLEAFPPWAALDPAPPAFQNQWLGDTLDAVTPRTLLIKEGLASGDLAQWNPYTVGGTAAAPLPDGANFSPMSLPWFLLPSTYAPGAVKLLEIAVITVGMSLFLRRLRLPSASWAVAALIYAASGFMFAWTNWAQTRVGALIPLLFWAVDRAVCERRWRDLVPVALVVAALIAGGFPAVTAYGLYAAAAYALVRVLGESPRLREVVRPLGVAALGVVAGVGLTAWQLLPFVNQSLNVIDFSVRAQNPDIHLEWTALTTAVVPEMLGGPIGAYWASYQNPIETFSYLGAAAVVLVLLAFAIAPALPGARGVRSYILAALAICMLLVYVGGLPLGLVQNLPVFSNNYIGRMRVLVGFFGAVAAALGLAAVLRRGQAAVDDPATTEPSTGGPAPADPAPRGRGLGLSRTELVRTGVAAVAAVGAVVAVHRVTRYVPPHGVEEVERGILVAAVCAGVVGLLALVVLWHGGLVWRMAFLAAAPVLLSFQAVSVADTWWPKAPVELFYPETPSHEFLAENLGDDRFISVSNTMMPGTSTAYGLRAANGHAFHTNAWKELLRAVDPGVMRTSTYSALTGQDMPAELASPILDRMGVRYATVPPAMIVPGPREVGSPADGTITVGQDGTATADLEGPMRGVILSIPEGLAVGESGGTVTVTPVVDGEPIEETVHTLGRSLPEGELWIALAADDVPDGARTELVVELDGTTGPVVFAADGGDGLAAEVVRPQDDGLRVVQTGGVTILERTTALSRIRWAGEEAVEPEPTTRVELLGSGELPTETVVLEDAADLIGAAGADGRVTSVEEGTNDIRVTIEADGDGWLVLADSVRGGGWTASVDGQEAELVDADHGMAAVAIPEGQHEVVFEYRAPGMSTGLIISGAVALSLLLLAVVPLLRRPRRG